MHSFLPFLALLHLMPAMLHAQGSGTVNTLALPSYTAPGYVIAADGTDSDPGTNRHLVAARANCTVNAVGSYAVEFSLLDPNNVVMATAISPTVAITTVPDSRSYDADIEPTSGAPLQPGVLYRLRARILQNATTEVAKLTGATGRTYLHFTGTDPLSIDRNALSEVTSVTIDREWILEPNATNSTIPVTVGYKVHRYDRWTTTPQSVNLDVTLTPTLTNDVSSTVEASTVTNHTFTVAIDGHDSSGTPPAPSTATGTRTIYVDPSVILKPQAHHIDVQSSHIEIPATSAVKTGGTFASASTFMLHLTGQLKFGSIVTHFTDISSTPFVIPSIPPPGVIQSIVRIDPKSNSGSVDGISDWHYGDATMINVVLDEFGNASYSGFYPPAYNSGTVLLKPDTPLARSGLLNGVQFRRDGDITLDTTGAHGELDVRLPTGVGWTSNRFEGLLSDQVEYGARDLNQSLNPVDALLNEVFAVGTFFLHEETKPIYVETAILQWDTVQGEFRAGNLCPAHSIRQPLLDFMAGYSASYADPSVAEKRSNDHVYNKVTTAGFPKFRTGTSGGGEMTAVLSITTAMFKTHMPYGAEVNYGSLSAITITDDLITPATSHLNTASAVAVGYNQHCQDALEQGCGTAVTSSVTVTPTTGKLDFTSDGGLHASGVVTMSALSWGAIPKAVPTDPQTYAHQVTTLFPSANFLMAGTFLRGDLNTLTDEDAPGFMLLSGYDPANLAAPERPATAAYTAGLGDYSGTNFRCDTGSHSGLSTLQGDPFGAYSLTTRSKYYVRTSGVTGIHEAPAGGFPGTATIGGYQFTLDSFGFSFLSTEQEDSRTAGELVLPSPTNFMLDFTEMKLSCLGAVESLEITGAGTVTKEFDFWDCLFTPYTATFVSTSTCDPGAGTTFVIGFGAHASHFEDEIIGALGIEADGTFLTPTEHTALAPDGDVPTRVRLPGSLQVIGSTGETYEFFPAQQAYLNDDAGATEGFWSLFGSVDVPFFRDMQVHLHTRCVEADNTSVLYIMGGWPSNGWLEASQDPFTDTTFDDGNDGYTGTLAAYRDSGDTNELYKPRAQQEWLGGILSFDYPLKWSNTAFNFTGLGPITKDIVVVQTQHELVFMDAENAEITFGVRYEGLPEINLTNFVFNAVDDATGTASAMVNAAGENVFGALENGVDEFANTLSDSAENLLGKALDAVTAPVLGNLITALKTKISSGVYTQLELETIISAHIGPGSQLTTALNKLDDTITNTNGFLYDLDARLAKIEQGIDSVINQVTIDPETGLSLPVEEVANGLLKQVNVDGELRRIVFESLSSALVGVLSTAVEASTIEEELNALIQEAEPTLAAITTTLQDVRDLISQVRTQIQGATDLGEEIQDIINDVSGGQVDIANLTVSVDLAVKEIVLSATTQDLSQLDDIAEEWRSQIAQEIKDAFYATQMVADIQEAVKERLYDLQASFNEAVDSAFAALNKAIRDALSEVLAELDTAINDTIGSFGDKLGAGSLTGYAHINGDSLDELRIDGVFELSVPDPMTINAYLQIKELDSDGPAGCSSAPGAILTEVTIGTTDMDLGWVGLGADGVRADMSVKFGLTGNVPSSMGGAFEMTSGTISFETFEIYKLAASVMFGTSENYIAAAIGVRFGEYDVAGGVFLGRSCDLEPLKMIDPLVADVVPTSTITGIYAYGEGTFPIYGTGTCFFQISAKAGAGVFYFQEGPTYGGRMTLGVFGEALCAVEVGAEISLAGSKSGDTYNFAGYGRVTGKAGVCPLCVKANFQVDLKYTDASGWDVNF
jgi:predicted  nucleic acid-binding Zn-ribbon protein